MDRAPIPEGFPIDPGNLKMHQALGPFPSSFRNSRHRPHSATKPRLRNRLHRTPKAHCAAMRLPIQIKKSGIFSDWRPDDPSEFPPSRPPGNTAATGPLRRVYRFSRRGTVRPGRVPSPGRKDALRAKDATGDKECPAPAFPEVLEGSTNRLPSDRGQARHPSRDLFHRNQARKRVWLRDHPQTFRSVVWRASVTSCPFRPPDVPGNTPAFLWARGR
jgi:hypothetical protein